MTLKLQNANVFFNRRTPDEVHALKDVNLTIDDGSFVMVVGSNGAGKSTLASVIAGSTSLTSGRIIVAGVDLTSTPDFARSGRISRVFADPLAGTVGDMSIEDNFAMAMARGHKRWLRLANSAAVRREITEAVAGLGLGLEHRLNEEVGKLSSGQRQSLTLAMACFGHPDVLILDEHLSALDPVTKERLTAITMEAARSTGCVALMITHSMKDAIRLGDRLLVMDSGSVKADFKGTAKASLTVDSLLEAIAEAGVELSDRSLIN